MDKAFIRACRNEQTDVVDSMIEKGYIPPPSSIVHIKESVDIFDRLIKFPMDIQDGFITAILNDRVHLLDRFFLAGANINQKDNRGHTPLLTALYCGYMRRPETTLKWLLDMGATEDCDEYGDDPMMFACMYGYTQAVEILLQHKTSKTIKWQTNHQGDTALHWACCRNHTEIVKLLLQHGAVQTSNHRGDTPLHHACTNSNGKMAKMLLEHGATITKNSQGRTPLHNACIEHRDHMYCIPDDIPRMLLQLEVDINSVDNDGDTCLHHACRTNRFWVVKLLLEKGAIQTQNAEGDTPLHLACHRNAAIVNNNSIVDILLQNIVQTQGQDIVRTQKDLLFQTQGQDIVRTRNKYGYTPFTASCLSGNTNAVNMLLAFDGTLIKDRNDFGSTGLHLACINRRDEIVQLLFNHGAVQLPDNKGNLPLHLACKQKQYKIIKLILKVEKHRLDSQGYNSSFYWYKDVVENKSYQSVPYRGVKFQNNKGNTPLHYACMKKDIYAAMLLHSDYTSMQLKNNTGDTPLHYACLSGNSELVKLLLAENGKSVPNNDGVTPLDIAQQKGNQHMISMIIENNASNAEKEESMRQNEAAIARNANLPWYTKIANGLLSYINL